MKKEILKRFDPQSPEYVIAHAVYKQGRGRGRRPSLSYKGEKNPQKALLLALTDSMQNHEERMAEIVLAVEAQNDRNPSTWKKIHKPSLGPYSEANPCVCLDCGQPREEWDEERICNG